MVAKKVPGIEYFLNDVFDNYLVTKNHIDTKIDWLLGICAIIIGLLLPYIAQGQDSWIHYGILLIALGAIVTFLISLLSLELPNFMMRRRPAEEGVMFFSKTKHHSSKEIFEELKKINNHDDILRHYAINLYNISERNIKIKDRLFKLASKILFIASVLGLACIIISVFIA